MQIGAQQFGTIAACAAIMLAHAAPADIVVPVQADTAMPRASDDPPPINWPEGQDPSQADAGEGRGIGPRRPDLLRLPPRYYEVICITEENFCRGLTDRAIPAGTGCMCGEYVGQTQ